MQTKYLLILRENTLHWERLKRYLEKKMWRLSTGEGICLTTVAAALLLLEAWEMAEGSSWEGR